MTYEQIEQKIDRHSKQHMFEIRFKTRAAIKGIFIKTIDYAELRKKNFWRIVVETHINEYKNTNNESLARIFNGSEFIKVEADTINK